MYNEFYKDLVGLEFIMANPSIDAEEMIKRVDKAIKEIKKKYAPEAFGFHVIKS